MSTYDDWKLATPPEYDEAEAPEEGEDEPEDVRSCIECGRPAVSSILDEDFCAEHDPEQAPLTLEQYTLRKNDPVFEADWKGRNVVNPEGWPSSMSLQRWEDEYGAYLLATTSEDGPSG